MKKLLKAIPFLNYNKKQKYILLKTGFVYSLLAIILNFLTGDFLLLIIFQFGILVPEITINLNVSTLT